MSYYEKQEAFELEHGGEIVLVEDNTEFFPGYDGNPGPGESWYDDPGYPDMTLGYKHSEITGNLKEMVLKRVGIDTSFGTDHHTVEIVERHENGGYCGTCAFEYLVFTIWVNGEQVYNESFSDNPFGVLQEWLTEEDDE